MDQIIASVEQTALAQVTIVGATFQALTARAPVATPNSPTSASGGISGTLAACANQVGVFAIGTDLMHELEIPPGQSVYQIDNLPPARTCFCPGGRGCSPSGDRWHASEG